MQLKSRVRLDPNVRLVFDEQQFQQRVRNKLRVSRFSSKLLQVPKEQNRSNCQVTRRRFMPTLERPPELSELKLHGVKRADGALKRPPLKVVKKLLFERRAISKSHCQAPIQLPLLQTAPVSTRPCWSPSSHADSFRIVDGHHPAGTRATPWPAIGFSIPNCVGKKPGHVWSLKWRSG